MDNELYNFLTLLMYALVVAGLIGVIVLVGLIREMRRERKSQGLVLRLRPFAKVEKRK